MPLINNHKAPTSETAKDFRGEVVAKATFATRVGRNLHRRIDARLVDHKIPTAEDILDYHPATCSTDSLLSLVKGLILTRPELMTARNEVVLAALMHQMMPATDLKACLQLTSAFPIARALQAISTIKNSDGDVEAGHNRAWWEWRTGVKDIVTDEQKQAANAQFARTNYLAAAGAAIAQAERANTIRDSHHIPAPTLKVAKVTGRKKLMSEVTIADLRQAVEA